MITGCTDAYESLGFNHVNDLNHWGWVIHIWVEGLCYHCLDNSLSLIHGQATNYGLLLIVISSHLFAKIQIMIIINPLCVFCLFVCSTHALINVFHLICKEYVTCISHLLFFVLCDYSGSSNTRYQHPGYINNMPCVVYHRGSKWLDCCLTKVPSEPLDPLKVNTDIPWCLGRSNLSR